MDFHRKKCRVYVSWSATHASLKHTVRGSVPPVAKVGFANRVHIALLVITSYLSSLHCLRVGGASSRPCWLKAGRHKQNNPEDMVSRVMSITPNQFLPTHSMQLYYT